MAELAAQIRSRQSLVLKALPAPVSAGERKRFALAIEIARSYYPSDNIYLGEPLLLYYLELARVTASDIGLGLPAVICALLSGVREGSEAWSRIDTLNDPSIKQVIEGLSRVTTLKGRDFTGQAENFRKLLLSLADDGRVILIALAERLLVMRRLDRLPEKERLPVASETYFLFAPLAHRLGYYNIKSEMEDLAMKLMEPEEYSAIEARLKQTTTSRNRLIREFSKPVAEKLDSMGIRYELKSRTKSIHSIWQKMKRQGVAFEEVFDIFAIRIIIDTDPELEKSSCWQVYSVVTDIYQPDPSRMRDWISVPRTNGYESLHITVVTPAGRWVEVQIRTRRMDEIAEKGLAAHFRYKGIKGEGGLDAWMTQMREVLGTVEKEGSDFLGNIRPGLYADEVFVFTPKGEVRQLPVGATLLDFAFDIHTEVGSKCIGGKINGRNVQLKHKLQNGDHVSVITSSKQTPKRDWLSFVITNKARTKIKQALNEEKFKLAADGKEMLTRRLKNWKISYGDAIVVKLLTEYGFKTSQDLYFSIAIGETDLLQIKKVLLRTEEQPEETTARTPDHHQHEETNISDYLIVDEKVEGLDYKLARCCNPVFGDRIFGFVTVLEGIKIHRATCPNADFMISNFPYRVVRARWTRLDSARGFLAQIRLTGVENLGIVSRITDILAEYKGVAVKNFTYSMNNGLFEGRIELLVPNINLLYSIIKKIQSVRGITRVTRVES
ncbi:MAG TPA: HD domain-containing protein [Bacteroidales bacterium]|nr:HD domain-containing protein [Bacteroidales bacterium]HPX54684.1 HD domain-containing protein [Bacteroidales bacterium]HQN59529.1 HD domain-containing protein [Bacteroidales bacterium]HQO85710.1 HD domain-containing protein [Bacteroidales bacterium]